MKRILVLTLTMITILFSSSVLIASLSHTTYAIQSTGNSLPETNSKKVCGDQLCSKVDSQHMMKYGNLAAHDVSPDISSVLEKMDEIHERHQQQMMQLWNTLTTDEKSQMYNHMQGMVKKMESLDLKEHIYMMFMSGQDHYNNIPMYSHDMPIYSHEKYQMNDSIAMQHLKTFDTLDFDVFTNQKWDRLESHSGDITVHWPDGSQTKGLERHIEDLKAMFVYAPDTRITEHPVKITSGEWTSVIEVMEGTFTEPMPLADGTIIPPTGKAFKLNMVTVGHWRNGVMDE